MESVRKAPYLLAFVFVVTPFAHLMLPYSHIPVSFIILSLMLATADKQALHVTLVIGLVSLAAQIFILSRIDVPMNLIHLGALLGTLALFLLNDQTLQQSIKKYRQKNLEMDMTQASSKLLREMIKRTIDLETSREAADQIVHLLSRHYAFDACTLFLTNQDHQLTVKATTASGDDYEGLEAVARARFEEARHTGRASVYKEGESIAKCLHSVKRGISDSYFCLIWERKDLAGALLIENKSDKHLNKTVNTGYFRLIVANLRLILKSALNHEQVVRLTMTDALTGAFDETYLNHILNQKTAEYHLAGKSFVIAMVGIDRLGQLNDAHGQAFGDLVLKEVASFIREHVHMDAKGEMLFRLASDQFVIFFSEVDADTIVIPLENLKNQLANRAISGERGETVTVTASFGVAEFPGDGSSAGELMANAEAAMRKSKADGRNRITYFEALSSSSAIIRAPL
ncbi:GGDEF domain-containing protein [Anoxynatronum sibiricum]|uniref:GGDEF domain-containing protein n=1 Tax=Anoxynatronum sibiricum TaxID=210623 RepID=A0ABU9VSX5_9CLOT